MNGISTSFNSIAEWAAGECTRIPNRRGYSTAQSNFVRSMCNANTRIGWGLGMVIHQVCCGRGGTGIGFDYFGAGDSWKAMLRSWQGSWVKGRPNQGPNRAQHPPCPLHDLIKHAPKMHATRHGAQHAQHWASRKWAARKPGLRSTANIRTSGTSPSTSAERWPGIEPGLLKMDLGKPSNLNFPIRSSTSRRYLFT
jgi:hypothetical protein